MNHDIDYSAQARTNPVFLTAKTAVCLMAEAGIPNACDIVHKLGMDDSASIPGMTDPEMILGNEIVVEAKYRTMCRLIEKTGYHVNVDLPCGYTPKALHMSEKGFHFIGLDLPIVAREMEQVIRPLAKHPENICFHGIDATNYESLEAALRDVDSPLCITTEGMMMYFTESEASAVVSNIHRLLEVHGGCWITPDPEFILQFFLTFRAVLGEGAIQKLLASRNTAASQSDVSNLTNSLILNPADVPASAKTATAFLKKHGLMGEKLNLADHMPELSVYRKLSQEQIAAFKQAMKHCHYWVITRSCAEQRSETRNNRAFGMAYTMEGETFRVSLSGRVDTITAPELLKAWEAEANAHRISAVEVDCSALDYISSAGLRVLLMMQKKCKKGVTVRNINEIVKEILKQTGFDSILKVIDE